VHVLSQKGIEGTEGEEGERGEEREGGERGEEGEEGFVILFQAVQVNQPAYRLNARASMRM
jgi:hypothetical protein